MKKLFKLFLLSTVAIAPIGLFIACSASTESKYISKSKEAFKAKNSGDEEKAKSLEEEINKLKEELEKEYKEKYKDNYLVKLAALDAKILQDLLTNS
ncbi:hypothetical protein [[Mycoplasma] collis]|uniref:hypothetical protein n=1 Tax=[Mycoplasma] collis TaxID=2127 RepID=UPI00051C1524|nr:hypothetical protein [[Mycoplasma] collis]